MSPTSKMSKIGTGTAEKLTRLISSYAYELSESDKSDKACKKVVQLRHEENMARKIEKGLALENEDFRGMYFEKQLIEFRKTVREKFENSQKNIKKSSVSDEVLDKMARMVWNDNEENDN